MRDIERDIRGKKEIKKKEIANTIRFYSKNLYMIDIYYIYRKMQMYLLRAFAMAEKECKASQLVPK